MQANATNALGDNMTDVATCEQGLSQWAKEMGRRGGLAWARKHSREWMSQRAKAFAERGWRQRRLKYGPTGISQEGYRRFRARMRAKGLMKPPIL